MEVIYFFMSVNWLLVVRRLIEVGLIILALVRLLQLISVLKRRNIDKICDLSMLMVTEGFVAFIFEAVNKTILGF